MLLAFFGRSVSSFSVQLAPRNNRKACKIPSLQLAFGLPDEDRQLRPPEDDEEASVADETQNSLVEKLDRSDKEEASAPKKDNKAMAFLRKVGRVGGAANKSFVNAVGSDEGSTGRQPAADRESGVGVPRKSALAYKECTETGIVDDMTEAFPMTSSGTEWRGLTDRLMGGRSNGKLVREPDLNGRPANVLTGHVSLDNNGGYLQMVTDLPLDASKPSVDASDYDGIEIDVLYRQVDESVENNSFNIHFRTPGTSRQASYRYSFQLEQEDTWETIRVPFSSFEAHGGDEIMPPTIDYSQLRRIGILGIGKEMDLFLAVSKVRFYSVF